MMDTTDPATSKTLLDSPDIKEEKKKLFEIIYPYFMSELTNSFPNINIFLPSSHFSLFSHTVIHYLLIN